MNTDVIRSEPETEERRNERKGVDVRHAESIPGDGNLNPTRI